MICILHLYDYTLHINIQFIVAIVHVTVVVTYNKYLILATIQISRLIIPRMELLNIYRILLKIIYNHALLPYVSSRSSYAININK